MATSASPSLSESLNSSWTIDCDWYYQLQDLPNEVLVLILQYLPLPDLANTRLVCSRLQKLVDDNGCRHLWAKATLEDSCLWLSPENKQLIQRAAGHGNVEALIMLAVAHLYSEGVPEGAGKGTYDAYNGIMATEYLIRAEELTPNVPPFSWVLFRPPWASNSMCCKACVCQRMKDHCEHEQNDSTPTGIHYCIGKVLSFQETNDHSVIEDDQDAVHWFELGSQSDCLHSTLEVWRKSHKPNLWKEPYEAMRQLRAAISHGGSPTFLLEAKLELCSAYARGFYGGKSREQAMGCIKEVMRASKAILWDHVYQLQENVSHSVRYILIDWIIEVAGMKFFSPQTVHLAVNLIDRYLIHRRIHRSKLQLLGITALLLAARWSSEFILTVREASWLTEETYQYEDVVRMMGGLVAAFKGEVKKETVCDYLDVMLDLIKANPSTRNMAYYLSECLLLHTKFGRYSASHLAAACLLKARILLGQEYPWPHFMVEATGYTVSDLRKSCLAIYDECLTDKNMVTDYRKIKLESVVSRYATDTFGSISKHQFMSYKELKEQLGVDPDSSYLLFTPTPKPSRQTNKTDKLLSFLSDSCYLTPGTSSEPRMHSPLFSASDSDTVESRSSSRHSQNEDCLEISGSLVEQFDTHSLSSTSPDNLIFSPSELNSISSPYSPSCCSSQSLTVNPSASGFPQPLFADCEDSPPSSPSKDSPLSKTQDKAMCTFSPLASFDRETVTFDNRSSKNASIEFMDTEDTLFAQSQKGVVLKTPFETRTLSVIAGPTPLCATSCDAFKQGSEETPIESDTLHSSSLAAKQHLFSTVSNSLKLRSFKENSGRVALKPLNVENIVSPARFYGDKLGKSEHSALIENVVCAPKEGSKKRRQGRRRGRASSRK